MELTDFLKGLLSEGGTLGVWSWGASAAVIYAWQELLNKGEMSNNAKRWVSVLVPAASVALAYLLGWWMGVWPIEPNSVFKALQVLAVELGGSKAVFTATKSIEGKAERPV